MTFIILILMNVAWGASYTFMKWGMDYLAPAHLLFLRVFISVLAMFFISYKDLKLFKGRDVWTCALLGAIMAGSHTLNVLGVDRSFATDGALLYALEPLAAIVFAKILLKEKMGWIRCVALSLALLGFFVLSDVRNFDLFDNKVLIGNLLLLTSVVCDGLFSPVAKPVTSKYPARAILFVALCFTLLFITPLAVLTPIKSYEVAWQGIVAVLYLSIICTVVGWTLWLYFLKKFPVNVIAITVFIQPITGPFVAHFTLGEQIGSRVWFGGSIIILAVALSMIKRKNKEEELIAEAVGR